MKKIIILFLFILFIFSGYFLNLQKQNISLKENKNLIAKFTKSPNEDYVNDEKDKVCYNISFYQKDEKNITVKADSNSAFFKDIQKDIHVGKKIKKEDIQVEWENIMGTKKTDKKNQIVQASVKIKLHDENQLSFKINFAKNAMKMITENLKKQ